MNKIIKTLAGLILVLMAGMIAACASGSPAAPTATIFAMPTATTPVKATITATPPPDVSVCAAGCDFKTIQAAVDAVNISNGAIIGVQDPVHTEAGITVNKNLTIQGMSAAQTIIQAHDNLDEATDRVLSVSRNTSVILRGLTIRHGNTRTNPQSGGGIKNEGNLAIEDCVISENSASAGGGILNDGTLTIINSSIKNNRARGGGDSLEECDTGGGIKNMQGPLTLINSTVSDNNAVGKGGGIHVACKGILTLENSTISGNRSNQSGGGIFLNGSGCFTNSTISNNEAHTGGGITLEGSGEKGLIRGHLAYTNTIIANNVARFVKYGVADCLIADYGEIGANVNNWVGDGNCSPTFSGDPALGPLADNGGSTQTHNLLPNSPAIDAIQPISCTLSIDQRGEPRIAPCDIGAFEVQK